MYVCMLISSRKTNNDDCLFPSNYGKGKCHTIMSYNYYIALYLHVCKISLQSVKHVAHSIAHII